MKPRSRFRCPWALAATALTVVLLATGAALWHRAVFGPWSDAWNLGNNLTLSVVCRPLLYLLPFLALLGLLLAVPLSRRQGRRWLGLLLIAINALVLITTASAAAWDRKSTRLLRSGQPLTTEQNKWFTPWGWTLESQLHHAVRSIDEDLVRLLIREGADVNAPAPQLQWRPAEGPTPLEAAVAMNHAGMIKLLLELGADAHQGERYAPVWNVVRSGDLDLLEVMHQAGASLPAETMVFACREGRTELVKWLIDHGWDLHAPLGEPGTTELERHGQPLHIAAASGHIDTVILLLDHGADINNTGTDQLSTPLMMAAQRADTGMLEFLLDRGADPAVQARTGWNAVHSATLSGSAAALEILIDHAPDLVNARTNSGATPLWLACMAYRKPDAARSVRFLLAHGADPGVTNREGKSISDVLRQERETVIGRGDDDTAAKIEAVIDLLDARNRAQ